MSPEQKALDQAIQAALIKADSVGNIEDARKLADQLRTIRAAIGEPQEAKPNPAEGMSNFDLARAGAGKAMVDTGRGLGQLVGAVSRDDVAAARARDEPLTHTLPGMLGDIGGNTAMVLAPGGVMRGAGLAAGSPRLAAAGGAMLAPRTIPQALAVGAGQGLVQPSSSTAETAGNILLGGGLSAAFPALGVGINTTRAAAEPLHREGQDRILARLLQKTSGGDADLADRLRSTFEPMAGPQPANRMQPQPGQLAGELVPGSVPTLGQAAGNPGIAALERTLAASDPNVLLALKQRTTQQNNARVTALEKLAGTDGSLAAATDARETVADSMYGAARKADERRRAQAITDQLAADSKKAGLGAVGNTTSHTQEESIAAALRPSAALEDLNKRPSFKGYVAEARRLAENKGLDIGNPLESVQGLHYIKLAIDDALSPTATNALGRNAKDATMDMKTRLLSEIERISPEYEVARKEYATASKPINQMAVAQEITDRATNKLRGTVEPSKFANALTDKTAATATGFKGATLENTLTPKQLQQLEAIKADLARAEAAQSGGRGPGSDTLQKLAYSNLIDAAGAPTWLRNFKLAQISGNLASRGADAVYGRANKEMAARLSDLVTSPSAVSDLLSVNPQMQSRSLSYLLRVGAGAGAGVPAMLNAAK